MRRHLLLLAVAVAGCPELNFPAPARSRPDAGPVASSAQEVETRKSAECWRKDDPRGGRVPNTCRYCHTSPFPGSGRDDTARQARYPQEDNPFKNVTAGQRELDEQLAPSAAELSQLAGRDNFLVLARQRGGGDGTVIGQVGQPGFGRGSEGLRYFPDLDYGDAALSLMDPDGFVAEPAPGQSAGASPLAYAGLDTEHCAALGRSPCDRHLLAPSGWRAVSWLPFSHASQWPRLTGAWHVAFVRLPPAFRSIAGRPSRAIYNENFELLERALKGDPSVPTAYAGDAAAVRLIPFRYPIGFEAILLRFYVDPAQCRASLDCRGARVREVQVMAKTHAADEAEAALWGGGPLDSFAAREGASARELGLAGNGAGWDYAAFIEASDAAEAHLRPQTPAELMVCAGCHGPAVGAAVDSLYVLPRKLPGPAGWAPMRYRAVDPINLKTGRAEIAEVLSTFFGEAARTLPDGTLDPAAFFGPMDALVDASKRARQIVRAQDFTQGRDPILDEAAYHEAAPVAEDGQGAPTSHLAEAYAPLLSFDGGTP